MLDCGRPRPPDIDATANPFIDTLTTKLSESTLTTSFTFCPTGCTLQDFHVEALVHSLPNKRCSSDPQPTWLLKVNANIFSPFLCQSVNSCLKHGIVSSSFKSGYVTPLLKKADLNAADVKSYRPITNLSVAELAVGTSWSGYELVLGRSWLGYELAWYDLVRVRVDRHPNKHT